MLNGSLSTIPNFESSQTPCDTSDLTLQGKGIADSAVRASDMHSALQELETREKEVDL